MPPVNYPISTVPLRFPLGRKVSAPAEVVEFLDGSEQRWRTGPVLNSLSVRLNNCPASEVSAIQAWFEAQRGAYLSDWSITVGSEVLTNMALEADELAATEGEPTRYSMALQLRQTSPSGSWPSVTAVYPGIASGARITQRPWTSKLRYLTTRNDLASGKRYAYYEWSDPKHLWTLTYPSITPAELLTLMQHFVGMGGRWGKFTFTDPDSLLDYPNCRYDMDAFEAEYVDAGHCSVSAQIAEFFA